MLDPVSEVLAFLLVEQIAIHSRIYPNLKQKRLPESDEVLVRKNSEQLSPADPEEIELPDTGNQRVDSKLV